MILVTGGTGRLGEQIVRAARAENREVRALVRRGSAYFWLNDTGAHYFFGDLRDPPSLHRALRGCTHVIAAAGVRRERTDNHHGNVTEAGNIALVDAAVARGVEHVVLVSCGSVVHAPGVPAFRALLAAESHLQASGLGYTILRPGLYAASFADLLRRTEFNGATWLPGRPDAKVSPVAVGDLARMALASLTLPAARNRTVEVGGPDTQTMEVAFQAAAAACDMPAHHWKVPPAGLRGLALLARPLGRRWTHHLLAAEARFGHDTAVPRESTERLFGFSLTPFATAVAHAFTQRHPSEDPTARDEKVVHRQFNATLYEPGVVALASLPLGPPPRQD